MLLQFHAMNPRSKGIKACIAVDNSNSLAGQLNKYLSIDLIGSHPLAL